MNALRLLIPLLLASAAAVPAAALKVQKDVALQDIPVCVQPRSSSPYLYYSVGQPCGPATATVGVMSDGRETTILVCLDHNSNQWCEMLVITCDDLPTRGTVCWRLVMP